MVIKFLNDLQNALDQFLEPIPLQGVVGQLFKIGYSLVILGIIGFVLNTRFRSKR